MILNCASFAVTSLTCMAASAPLASYLGLTDCLTMMMTWLQMSPSFRRLMNSACFFRLLLVRTWHTRRDGILWAAAVASHLGGDAPDNRQHVSHVRTLDKPAARSKTLFSMDDCVLYLNISLVKNAMSRTKRAVV